MLKNLTHEKEERINSEKGVLYIEYSYPCNILTFFFNALLQVGENCIAPLRCTHQHLKATELVFVSIPDDMIRLCGL